MTFDEAVKHLEAGDIVYRPVNIGVKAFRLFKSPRTYGMRYEWEGNKDNGWNPGYFERADIIATDWCSREKRYEDDHPLRS